MKALQIDETLAGAHAALAFTIHRFDWDWSGAERKYRRAIELNPNAEYHGGYALYLAAAGRFDEAVEEGKLQQQLDPFSLAAKANLGLIYASARHYDLAAEQLRRTLELNPNYSYGRWALGQVLALKGQFAEAIAEFQRGRALPGGDPLNLSGLGHVYALSGRRDEARMVLAQLKASNQSYFTAYLIAIIYAALGETDHAFESLEKAYEERSDWMVWLKVDPRLDSLRSDPRFIDLMRRVGLAQ